MIATLLFDLDGTLVETDWAHFKAFERVLAEYGKTIDDSIFKAHVVGRSNIEIGAYFFPDRPALEQAAICDHKEAVYREIVGDIEPVPGVVALLDWADVNGIPCGVVTNAPRANAMQILDGTGLTKRFGTIICAHELPHAKPHPLPYQQGMADLGGAPGLSVAFEDSPSGMRSALGAGMGVVGMTTNLSAAEVLAVGAALAAHDFTDPALLAFVARRTGRG
ncbi:MAG: HAD family phosphatase [Proteobacteria bacterium]|nr:HAD family phosphatase [Pseudomonadota bacterium]